MYNKALPPAPTRVSQYGVDPKYVVKRGAELKNIVGVPLTDLVTGLPPVIFPGGSNDVTVIRKETEAALAKVDMSKITAGSTVNILASHHGFTFYGGQPYAEMLRTIKDVVEQRTGCKEVRLRAGLGMRFRETEEYIKAHSLDEYFHGKALGIAPIDAGIPIETELGTLFGLKKAYDADFIIHAHNSDVREVHFHRQVDRAVKPFGMSYARCETRSTYHMNLGPRAANFVARSIFESAFVQSKFAFACFLTMSPAGATGVDADTDLYALNDRVTVGGMRDYGKIMTLFGAIDECIAVLDFPCPVPYVFACGVIYANMACANMDVFDLDYPLPPYTWYTETMYDDHGKPLIPEVPPVNPAIKTVVHNYAWVGYPSVFFAEKSPTIVVGKQQAELFDRDPMNLNYMKHALLADNLDGAMDFAYHTTSTRKVILFDGAAGGLNVSEPLAEHLYKVAPGVMERVEQKLLPKWLAQRNVDPALLDQVA
ncbi:MAG: hypothetical protein KKC30_03705 [Proteobacteria bacterium]|nr:hypothetical protein [Pseudomonadota bacterium]MBU4383864.1 hypothetical protein [Pseudomonadota bacterium]MCG2763506.1 hypothetical protein [Desulfarculaceae bacterium]